MQQDELAKRACHGQDIISELPDVLRFHILTFLPRKYAIRTGALSPRWKDLWKRRFPHLTTLSFGRATQNAEDQREFANAIQKDMTVHGERKVETFNLYFYPGKEYEHMASEWIQQAITNTVEEFLLDFSQGSMGAYPRKQIARRSKRFELKERLFKCNYALTSLRLNYCRLQRYFKFKYFSCLEILCLQQINVNDFMLEKLVLNCQSLEVLELRQCLYLKHIKVPDTQTRLKKLIIANCYNASVISISAPKLHELYFFGRLPDSFVMFDNMNLLNDVILIASSKNIIWQNIITFRALVFLLWLDHVQVLTLCSWSLSAMFGLKNTTWIVFERLKELQLLMETMSSSDVNNIYNLFNHCKLPLLEKLFLELPTVASNGGTSNNSQIILQQTPKIIFQHLKTIKMINFKGYPNEMIILDFLLWSAFNLELIFLVFPYEFDTNTTDVERQSLFNKIMLKPRSSTIAQIMMLYSYQDDVNFKAVHSNVMEFEQVQV